MKPKCFMRNKKERPKEPFMTNNQHERVIILTLTVESSELENKCCSPILKLFKLFHQQIFATDQHS
jgi:hypothetical protein